MCISNRIQEIQAQKAALDAKIARLEELESKTEPIKIMLYQLIDEYRAFAPEELPSLLAEIAKTCNNYDFDDNLSPKTLNDDNNYISNATTFSQEEVATMANLLQGSMEEAIRRRADEAFGDDDNNKSEGILTSKGFFQPQDLTHFDADEKYETYRGWDIYFSIPNGGIVGIGLYNAKYNQLWDASTEIIEDLDSTFPESLADYDDIVKWTRALIDQVKNLEAPGQLALEFPEPTEKEEEIAEKVAKTDNPDPRIELFRGSLELTSMDMLVTMMPAIHGAELAGVTFCFNTTQGKRLFESSQTASEIGDQQPLFIALKLAADWKAKQEDTPPENHWEKPQDTFAEFIKISNSVGYLKRKDSGEILATYVGFSNKTLNGDRTQSSAKPRAQKWADHLASALQISCEARKAQRITSDISVMPFAYEIKIKGMSIGQLQKLAEEDFSLLPNELPVKKQAVPAPKIEETSPQKTYTTKVNSYVVATGTEEETRDRFEQELLLLGGPTGNHKVVLMAGNDILEAFNMVDFKFTKEDDFDEINSEYSVSHPLTGSTQFTIWITAGTCKWRHSHAIPGDGKFFETKEAAAVDAVRTMLAKQKG